MFVWRSCRLDFLVIAMLLALLGPAHAQSGWTLDSVRGTVVRFDAERWVEVAANEAVPLGVPLRTLSASSATLQGTLAQLSLGAGTLVRFLRYRGDSVLIEQYSGSIEIAASVRGEVALRTPTLEITTDGILAVAIVAGITSYEIRTGSARVRDVATGQVTLLDAAAIPPDNGLPSAAGAASQTIAAGGGDNGQGAGNGPGTGPGNNPGAGQGNNNGNGASAGQGNNNGNAAGQGNGGSQGNSGNGGSSNNGKKQ